MCRERRNIGRENEAERKAIETLLSFCYISSLVHASERGVRATRARSTQSLFSEERCDILEKEEERKSFIPSFFGVCYLERMTLWGELSLSFASHCLLKRLTPFLSYFQVYIHTDDCLSMDIHRDTSTPLSYRHVSAKERRRRADRHV